MTEKTAPLLVEENDGVLSIRLNRPEASNALSTEMVERFMEALDVTTPIRLCVITAEGKNFCAGFDLSDIDSLSDGDLLWRFCRIEMLLQKIHHAPFPVLVQAQGFVVGAGVDIFASCWKRMATADASFKMPGWHFEIALGTRRLANLLGSDKARDLLIDSQRVGAEKAEQYGLVNQIVEQEDWSAHQATIDARCKVLSDFSKEKLLSLTINDTRDADLAALVRTAGRPGLKQRIMQFQAEVKAMRLAKKREKANEG